MEIKLSEVKELPPVRRGGGKRQSEEAKAILAALQSGKPQAVEGIESKQQHNALQQRIRGIAAANGLNVTIRYQAEEQRTYFGLVQDDDKTDGKTSSKK